MKESLPSDLAAPKSKKQPWRYNLLSEEEKKVEEIFFLFDNFCVSDPILPWTDYGHWWASKAIFNSAVYGQYK